jgi:hydroxymethylpyrimidine/phosphomethylpyrimidine kinase
MVSKSGHSLLQDSAADALRGRLLPLATLLTPNLPEAARLCGREMTFDEAAIQQQAELLIDAGASAVLMKGGHNQGKTCVDLLVTAEGVRLRLEAKRIDTKNTHGTGCTLSSAIAAGFALGLPLEQAVSRAHEYLQGAIRAADQLQVGHGHGPVHHFYRQWD